jgi:hypothetical protein
MAKLDDATGQEVAKLIIELVRMAKEDPNVNNEDAHCWLSREQRPRSIEIGKRLYEIGEAVGVGGFELMYFAHDQVRQQIDQWGRVDNVGSLVRGLEMAWDGIGPWAG